MKLIDIIPSDEERRRLDELIEVFNYRRRSPNVGNILAYQSVGDSNQRVRRFSRHGGLFCSRVCRTNPCG